jgi:hypothetical protein
MAGLPSRFQCGQRRKTRNLVKSINEAQAEAAMRETAQVANQPHRRGDCSTMAGSELGRFILKNFTPELVGRKDEIADYQRETYESCESYARNVWHWNMNKGIPMPSCMAWEFVISESLGDNIEEQMKVWKERISEADRAMKCAGQVTFFACRDLILFDYSVANHPPARRALQSLHMAVYKS